MTSRGWVIDQGTIAEDGPPSQVVDDPQTAIAPEFFSRLRANVLAEATPRRELYALVCPS